MIMIYVLNLYLFVLAKMRRLLYITEPELRTGFTVIQNFKNLNKDYFDKIRECVLHRPCPHG